MITFCWKYPVFPPQRRLQNVSTEAEVSWVSLVEVVTNSRVISLTSPRCHATQICTSSSWILETIDHRRTTTSPLQPVFRVSGVFGFASSSWLHLTNHPQTTSAIYLGLLSKNCRDSQDWPALLTNGKQNDSSNDSDFNLVPYRDDNTTHTVETFAMTRIPVRFTASSIISSCEVQ